MSTELLTFLAMIGVFLLGCFLLKLPVSISMVLSAIAGALVGGKGIPLRHLVEGMFAYVDTILVIVTAMIFMKVIQESGALDAISSVIIERFHKVPALMLCLIMVIIMFPGMITGSSTASVLSAGSIMAPVLMLMGVPMLETACILAMGGILGMIAPPTNIPAMIIGAGIDIPYSGFGLPLALMTFPLAFLFVLMFGYKYVKSMNYEEVRAKLRTESREKYGLRIYIPLVLAIVLMVINKAVPSIPDMGMPMVFLISAAVGCFTGNRFNVAKMAKESVNSEGVSQLRASRHGNPDGRRNVHPDHDAYRCARTYRQLLPEHAQFRALHCPGRVYAAVRRSVVLRLCQRAGRSFPSLVPREEGDHCRRRSVTDRVSWRHDASDSACRYLRRAGSRYAEVHAGA